jgi:hypothetical protein
MRRCVSLTSLLILVGCKPDPELPTLVTMVDAAAAERAELALAMGVGEVVVPVRTLNRYGAAVEGGELELSVSGATATTAETSVLIDPTGYGELEVTTEAPETFTVGLVSSSLGLGLGDAVSCWSLGGELPGWGLRSSHLLPDELSGISAMAPMLEGVVLVTELDVWFQGMDPSARPHRVLGMADPILEAESVHIDNDGVADLLVRSVDEVVLLRGRAGGGLSWGAGFAAEGLEIVGASVEDADGDGRSDVAFGLQGSEGATVVIMRGDGAWGFEELEELRFEPDYSIVDLELSQSDADGMAELAMLTSSSVLMRYYWTGETWAETYPSTLETHLAEPASFLGAADLNAGGAEEPIMLSHPESGVQQSVVFLTLDGDTTQYQKSYLAPHWALEDLSGDLLPDILALEGGELHLIHFVTDEGNPDFSYHTLGGVYLRTGTDADEDPEQGPITAGLFDGDRIPDLVMATDALHLFPGKEVETGWASSDGRWTSYDLQLLTAPALADLDGKAGLDTMAGWVTSYSVPVLRTWWIEPDPKGDPPTLERRGEILLDDGATPLGVALVDGRLYGLVDFDGAQLIGMGLTESDTYDEIGRVSVDGATLVGGHFADGAEVAVISAEGEVSYRDASLAEVGSGSIGAYGCVVAIDSDGDGLDELVTGSDAGCALLAVDLDGDGPEELVSADSGDLVASWAGAEHTLAGAGALAAHDLDGDGQPEILAASGARLWIHRAVGDGFPPGTGRHGANVFGDFLAVGDVTGDGLEELITVGEDGMFELLWGVE